VFVFVSERGSPFTTAGFARMIERAGKVAKLGIKVHVHMLRHSTGFKLANDGHDTRSIQGFLGHRNIQILSDTQNWHLIASKVSGVIEALRAAQNRACSTYFEEVTGGF
jgi:site-specific recombinase XerD